MALPKKGPSTRTFWKCPTCGSLVGGGSYDAARRRFTLGAIGQHPAQVLVQTFHGRAIGGQDGGIVWKRRPAREDELLHYSRAVAAAGDQLLDRLGHLPAVDPPEVILAELDDAEAARVAEEWLLDAQDELERRRQIVIADLRRRQ